MAKDKKKLVQAITPQEENFAQWYTDICVKAELVEYSSVKGFINLRPYGYAIVGEHHPHSGRPVSRPAVTRTWPCRSDPRKPSEEGKGSGQGLCPGGGVGHAGRLEKLEERLCVRPTSETMFCDHLPVCCTVTRELPMKYNQWCSVVRWEKTTRPVPAQPRVLVEEGHTIHETAAEAEERPRHSWTATQILREVPGDPRAEGPQDR